MRCGVCGEEKGTKHAERCRGQRLRQPVHQVSDWEGLMADQDTYDLRGTGGYDYGADAGVPWERRHGI
jgi:hypothetical protein